MDGERQRQIGIDTEAETDRHRQGGRNRKTDRGERELFGEEGREGGQKELEKKQKEKRGRETTK